MCYIHLIQSESFIRIKLAGFVFALKGRLAVKIHLFLVIFLGLLPLSCESLNKNSSGLTEPQAREAAIKHLEPFKKKFMQALMTALQSGGPEAAVLACHQEAPKIPADSSTPEVTVGRTSHKLRQSANAPKTWMKPYLDQYAGTKNGDLPSERLVALNNGEYGYLQPIYIKPLCLTCHGSNLSEGVDKKLSKLYPEDKGRGFKLGEFRGFFWAEVIKTASISPTKTE